MYAAILAENAVNFADIKAELSKRGWAVFGKDFVQLEKRPPNVMVWILYARKTLDHRYAPTRGYVRIASVWAPLGRAYFHVIKCGSVAFAYYHVLMWVLLMRERAKRRIRKALHQRIGKNI